jgi:hypothetical protein
MKNQKAEYIAALRRFAACGGARVYDHWYDRLGYNESRGDRVLAGAIADYLDDPGIPIDEYVNWFAHLDEFLVDAFEDFRTLDKWRPVREKYAAEHEHRRDAEIPDLVNAHVGGLHRMLAVMSVSRLCATLAGERECKWLRPRLEAHFGAQQSCIDQAWSRFVRVGYRELMPRIKEERHRGNSGEFGRTTLLTWACAGRVMFTFKRGKDEDDVQITYIADDSDMRGVRSGSNATRTPFVTCIEMINEVSDGWALDRMKPDKKVGMF